MDVETAAERRYSTGVAAEGVLSTEPDNSKAKAQRRRSRKKAIKPRPLPFFARDGHVLFVGNDRVEDGRAEDDF